MVCQVVGRSSRPAVIRAVCSCPGGAAGDDGGAQVGEVVDGGGVDAEVEALDVLVEEAVLVEQLAVEVGDQAAVELAVVVRVGDDEGAGEGVGDVDEDADLGVVDLEHAEGVGEAGEPQAGRRLRSLRGLRPRRMASREYSVQATSGPPKWSARKPSIARCSGMKRRRSRSSRLARRWRSGVVRGAGLAARARSSAPTVGDGLAVGRPVERRTRAA
jgi:hypothetical protein